MLDWAEAFASAFVRAEELGITLFDEACLPLDAIDFANPMAPAPPAPEGRNPKPCFSV